MYSEKPKREEKPKRNQNKHALIRFILALLFLVPSLFFILRRFNGEEFVDMALLTAIITLTVYLVYQVLLIFFSSALDMQIESPENSDLSQESGNH